MFKELILRNFKGFKEYKAGFEPGINIIYGKSGSGKSSIIDSIMFLQYYSLYYGSIIRSRILADPSHYAYSGETEFYITAGLRLGDEEFYLRLDVDVEKPEYIESFIFDDTVFTYKSTGRLSIKDARKSRYTPREMIREIRETIWDAIGVRKIVIGNLPWRSLGHLVSIEASYWGGILEASKHVPEIISRTLISRIRIDDKETLDRLRRRLRKLFKLVFLTHSFLRGLVVVKYIDLKNAIGPSKLISRIFDPYASNFPWILLLVIRRGYSGKIKEFLRKLGYSFDVAVGSTIDNRYYVVLTHKSKILYLHNLSTSIVKSLILYTALLYSNGVVVIDDFDEYLDEIHVKNIIKEYRENTVQSILTTRNPGLKEGNVIEL